MKRILITFLVIASMGLLGMQAYAQEPFNLPFGIYQQSCWACTIDHGQLNCNCNNRNGIPQITNLGVPRDCQTIENINGQLTCTQFKGHYLIRWIVGMTEKNHQ